MLTARKKSLQAFKKAVNEEDVDYVVALFFDSSANAKAYYDKYRNDIERSGDVCGQCDNCIYAGTDAAVRIILG